MLQRYALLSLGIALTAFSAVCAFTPLLWNLEGRPSESYPELLALFYWLPAAVVVLLGGVAQAFFSCPPRDSRTIFWIGIALALALPVYTGLVIGGLFPSSLRAETLALPLAGAALVIYSGLTRKKT